MGGSMYQEAFGKPRGRRRRLRRYCAEMWFVPVMKHAALEQLTGRMTGGHVLPSLVGATRR
jgi:hypothetical protein